jgi:hypothetical protein
MVRVAGRGLDEFPDDVGEVLLPAQDQAHERTWSPFIRELERRVPEWKPVLSWDDRNTAVVTLLLDSEVPRGATDLAQLYVWQALRAGGCKFRSMTIGAEPWTDIAATHSARDMREYRVGVRVSYMALGDGARWEPFIGWLEEVFGDLGPVLSWDDESTANG